MGKGLGLIHCYIPGAYRGTRHITRSRHRMNNEFRSNSKCVDKHYEALTWLQQNFEMKGFDILTVEFQASDLNLPNVSSYFLSYSNFG